MALDTTVAPSRHLKFKDFVPTKTSSEEGYQGITYNTFESLESTLKKVDEWMDTNPDYGILNVETVVLPNIHGYFEDGSKDQELEAVASNIQGARWYQFFRVWYR